MKRLILLVIICFSRGALAQFSDVVEIEREGQSKAINAADARKEIIDSVVEGVAVEYIIDMIGRDKYAKNGQLVRNKILRETGRFIPVVKNGELRATSDGALMSVQLKISLKNLKSLLLEHGLLYSREGLPVIFPFIELNDRVHNITYRWWAREPTNDTDVLRGLATKTENAVKQQLFTQGFYGALPTSGDHRALLPEILQQEQPTEKTFDFFSSFFAYDIYLDGYIVLEPNAAKTDSYHVGIKWVAKYHGTHRVVAEVNRNYVTETGPFDLVVTKILDENLEKAAEDLAVQLVESWQKGTFGAALFTIVLRGPMTYPGLDSVKQQLLANAKYIKSVRERKFEQGRVTLEADVAGDLGELGAVLRKTELKNMVLKISEIGPTQAVIDLIAQ